MMKMKLNLEFESIGELQDWIAQEASLQSAERGPLTVAEPKPKRKRRTKAEMAAARAASEPVPPKGPGPSEPTPPYTKPSEPVPPEGPGPSEPTPPYTKPSEPVPPPTTPSEPIPPTKPSEPTESLVVRFREALKNPDNVDRALSELNERGIQRFSDADLEVQLEILEALEVD